MSCGDIRILDTGTRPPDDPPDIVDLRHAPALVRRPLPIDDDQVAAVLAEPAHIIFYSRFSTRVVADDDVIPTPARHKYWTVGDRTAALAARCFDTSPRVPDDESFDGLRRFLATDADPRPIVAFGLRGRHRDLSEVATKLGVEFTVVDVYQSTPADPELLANAFKEHRPHWLTVTSSRGAKSVADGIGIRRLRSQLDGGELSIVAIGPSTAQTVAELGLDTELVADHPSRNAMIDAIIAHGSTDPGDRCEP